MFFKSTTSKEVSSSFVLPSTLLPIVICDSEEKIIQVNDSFCHLLGYSYQELLDTNISDITDLPNNREETFTLSSLKSCFVVEYEKARSFKGKLNVIETLVNVSKICDDTGKYLGRMIIVQRVYEREKSKGFITSTAFKVGPEHHDEYLENITQELAKNLESDFILIASFSEDRKYSEARLLLYENQFYKKITFNNEGTPLEKGLDKKVVICKDGLAEQYLNNSFFEQYGFHSFLMVPLFNRNHLCLGFIYSMRKKSILKEKEMSDLILDFAKKIEVELERSDQLHALIESERRYKLVFDHSTDGIIISDYKQGRVIDFNQKVLDLFRIDKKTLENLNNSLDFSPEFQPDGRPSKKVYEEIYFKAFTSGKLQTYKWRFQRLDKSEFDAEVTLTPYDHTPGLSRWMVIIRDITEQKKSEKRAEELKQLRIQETLNLSEKEELQIELDYRSRELSSNLLLDAQKGNQLTAIRESLQKMVGKVDTATRKEINRLIRDIDRNIDLEADWKKFQIHFEEVHPNFFSKLKNKFPALSPKQLRHCAYIKLGLSSKETAELLNLAPKSIEMARYRLKKKMLFMTGDRFYDYILSL